MRKSVAKNASPAQIASTVASRDEGEQSEEEESDASLRHQQIAALEAEIASYERSFVSQEKCLAGDARRRCIQDMSDASISSAVASFPYEDVLRMWRREAQKHITRNILAEKKEQHQAKETHTKLLMLEERLQSSEQRYESAAARLAAQQETNKRLASANHQQAREYNDLNEAHALLRHQYDEIFAQQKQLRSYLEKFRRLLDREGILSNAMMMQVHFQI